MVICIDWDGTIVEDVFPDAGIPRPGAVEFIKKLKERGHKIVIWSCRNNKRLNEEPLVRWTYLKSMKIVLDAFGIPYDDIDLGEQGKYVADLYIDDRAITFTSWPEAYQQVLAREQK